MYTLDSSDRAGTSETLVTSPNTILKKGFPPFYNPNFQINSLNTITNTFFSIYFSKTY
jgi:hypothetical protein